MHSARAPSKTTQVSVSDETCQHPQPESTDVHGSHENHGDGKPGVAWKIHIVSIVIILLCTVAWVMLSPTTSQYIYYRTGMNYFNSTNHSKSQSVPCHDNTTSEDRELQRRVQAETSNILLYLSLAEGIPSVFMNLFLGSYSDILGRKMLFLIPVGGNAIRALVQLLVVALDWELYFLYLAYALEGLCGGRATLIQAVFIVNADVTSAGTRRTSAVSVVEGAFSVGSSLTSLVTGYLILSLGYLYPSVIVLALFTLAMLGSLIFIPNTAPAHKTKKSLSPLHHARNVVRFYVEGNKQRQLQFRLAMTVFFLVMLNVIGRMGITTLYQLNRPFCWNSVKVGYFVAAQRGLAAIVSTLVNATVQHWLRLETLLFVGVLSTIAALLLEGLAVNDVMLYLVTVVGVMSIAPLAICRALMSKWTPPGKQGAMFAGVAAMEALCYAVSHILYNSVYAATLSVFRGLVFLVMAGTCLIAGLLTLWLRHIAVNEVVMVSFDAAEVNGIQAQQMEAQASDEKSPAASD